MGVSKVIVNGVTRVDLTQDTVDETNLLSGETATGADGEHVEGAFSFETQAKTVSPTENQQVVTPDTGKAGLSQVTVNAISSNYIGSGVTRRTQNDMTVSGATVTAPAGYYANSSSKSVANGTAGTPTATKGEVSNRSITVTPSVTNTTGYITGSTKTGTAVTVNVSELESGTKTITENGTGISVSGYSAVDVNVPSAGSVSVEPLNVTQNGTYTAPEGTAYSPVTVAVEGGSTSAEAKDVNFFDYDGTIVYSYTPAEFAELTEMPANPSHARLTAQGWNWSLTSAKAYVAKYGKLNIGQMYITSSGATEIDITLTAPDLHPYLGIAPNGTVVIDWGDGTATDTVTGTSDTTLKFTGHEYASAGNYTINLTVSSGDFAFYCSAGNRGVLSTKKTYFDTSNRYSNSISSIRLGANVTIGDYAFNFCNFLTSVTIPNGMTSMGKSAFTSCRSLKSLTIPSSVTSIGNFIFSGCVSLKSITIPNGVTSIGNSLFYECRCLSFIAIPDSITSIGSNAFYYNESLLYITIPDSVTSIGASAFYMCISLKSVTIHDGVTSIGNSSFYECYCLQYITIPGTVTSIGTQAFYSCKDMHEYHFLATTPPKLSSTNAFSNVPTTCVFYVPSGSLKTYKTTSNWSTYASHMQEE